MGETGFLHCNHSPIQMDFCQYNTMHDFSLHSYPTPGKGERAPEHEFTFDKLVNVVEADKRSLANLVK